MSELDCWWAAFAGGCLGGSIVFYLIYSQFKFVMKRFMSHSQNFKTWQKVNILEQDLKLLVKDINAIKKSCAPEGARKD